MTLSQEEVEKKVSRKVRLANLYLYHAIAFVHGLKVRTTENREEEPNEFVMRFVENEGSIPESECVKFRQDVVDQLPQHRMDILFGKLNDVFELMVDVEASTVNFWFDKYPVTVPQCPKPTLYDDAIPF